MQAEQCKVCTWSAVVRSSTCAFAVCVNNGHFGSSICRCANVNIGSLPDVNKFGRELFVIIVQGERHAT